MANTTVLRGTGDVILPSQCCYALFTHLTRLSVDFDGCVWVVCQKVKLFHFSRPNLKTYALCCQEWTNPAACSMIVGL